MITKEVDKRRDKGEKDVGGASIGESRWSLPSHIICFIAPTIEKIGELRLKLMPWPDFKRILMDLIDFRIEHAPEIHGATNTSYMTLDECLIIYVALMISKDGGNTLLSSKKGVD